MQCQRVLKIESIMPFITVVLFCRAVLLTRGHHFDLPLGDTWKHLGLSQVLACNRQKSGMNQISYNSQRNSQINTHLTQLVNNVKVETAVKEKSQT